MKINGQVPCLEVSKYAWMLTYHLLPGWPEGYCW